MRTALMLCAVLLLPLGCRPSSPTPAAAAANVRSPTQTVEQLIEHRRGRQYERMHPLIIATQRYEVVKYLRAMDAYLRANEQLCVFVRNHIAIGLSQTIDQSGMAGNLNIFSQYVTLLDETIDGDTATLSFLVDEKLPARRADLDRVSGQWLYDPGDGDYAKIIPAVERMADGLRRVLQEMRSGRLDPAAMREHPAQLIEAVRIRLLPGVKMLPAPPKSGDGG